MYNKIFFLILILNFTGLLRLNGLYYAKEIQVTFNVVIPSNTPSSDIIYLYGSMNNWDPGPFLEPDSTDLALNFVPSGVWQIKIYLSVGATYQYKYTRGSLETLENNTDSTEIELRSVFIDEELDPLIFYDTVFSWKDFTQPPKPENGTPVLTFYNSNPQTDIAVSWATETFAESKIYYGIGDENENILDITKHTDMISNGDKLIHHAEINNLQPNSNYKYKVITNGVYESDLREFKTADYSEKFMFVVIGDNRPGIDTAVMQGVINDKANFVLHTGDLVQYGTRLAYWFDLFADWAPLLNTIPMMPIYGNHEVDAYLNRFFKLPGNNSSDPDNSGHWYSFDYNNVHIISLDCYRGYTEGTEQYNWLISDLENIPATADFVFIQIHEPPFTSGIGHGSNLDIRENLTPIFDKYKVDIVFAGHEHIYERSFVNDIYYIVTGGAGSPLYNLQAGSNKYSIFAETVNHYCRVKIDGKKLLFEMVRSNGTIGDSFEIIKKGNPPVTNSFLLEQNYPNPFNSLTKIKFSIVESSFTSLKIYNILGEEVTTLFNENKQRGNYVFNFNAKNLVSGVYFAVLSNGSNISTIKLLLLK